MLKFYYNPLSPNARRVWLTLLEKNLTFETVLLKLDGDQFKPEFLEINPFHHIPVLEDNGLRLVESLAIMDYLEAKYPTPALLPTSPEALAKVRMVQLLTANELFSPVIQLICQKEDSPQFKLAKRKLDRVLKFLSDLLGNSPYFASDQLTLGDIVAVAAISLLPKLEINLTDYPNMDQWFKRLMQREPWQKTDMSAEDFEEFKRRIKVLVKLRARELIGGNKTK
ncbi:MULTISPECIES: glutathione S-transferase family protein [Moorena]|uniref:Glutathione S-transferase n=3 Tax=Moorena TaxID=1155738 RepID=F4XL70_9CYAN|nr:MULTISPECIES: glutathione S-transferase family protein [Moorena]EGJ34594.1 glutathione S-transferase [Moorena producens 3L]NEP32279.1 glutathione S-transferase family protein [Moorena sp. SIO3B2]NEP69079.1 glutathione S-transferase family protein [Moorena sp. SIO3A5]NET68199.1 glutathione S-transferase family protein [Moorena sp. SIO1G6]OLT67067.1 glutathione S-transferase [Moorena producens 3L]